MPAPEPEIDDITPELEEDDAFAAFAIGEASGANAAQPPRDLFDIESAEDLAIDPEPQRFKSDFDPDVLDEPMTVDRFADTFEPELPVERELEDTSERQPRRGFQAELDDDDDVHGYVPPPRRSIDYVPEDQYGAGDPPRRRTLPLVLMLLLGIIIGLGAGIGIGYGIRSASQTADANAAPDDKAPPAAAETAGAKPYSEQTVTPSQQKPPTEPPPIPADAPAPSAPSAAPARHPSHPLSTG